MSEEIKEVDDPVARFLAAGGKIQHNAYKESGRVEGSKNIWGSKKPGRPPAAEVANTEDKK